MKLLTIATLASLVAAASSAQAALITFGAGQTFSNPVSPATTPPSSVVIDPGSTGFAADINDNNGAANAVNHTTVSSVDGSAVTFMP